MRSNLAHLLDLIQVPQPLEARFRYHVKPIPGFESHYFGRTSEGAPCLLLNAENNSFKAPIRLAAIEVSFAIPCHIAVTGGDEKTKTLTAIICTASDQTVQDYFAYVCETIVRIVGMAPSLQEVIEAVLRLVDLFQKLSSPARRSVIGLFGELYAIYSATSPATAVDAWRSTIDDRFDFSIGDVRLEVKASSTRHRSHYFSLEQCTPPPGTVGFLISLFVETSGGGMSLLELVERIEGQLDGDVDLILKLQETVAEGLGAAATTALSMRFDEDLARSSLQVYELEAIPAVRDGVPGKVSQVRFRSDISRTPVADVAALITLHQQARALLPARA